jgi:tetratricopeptide (TPR) repeat protein
MTINQDAFQKAMNLGHSAAWDQMWDQAARYYRQALDLMPDSPKALTSLGLALFEMQYFDEAMVLYQRAARVAPNDPVSIEKMARIYERQGKMEEGINAFMQAAELHLKARNAEKAIENWINVVNLQPEHLMARTRLAMIYERLGRKSEAVTGYLATASLLQRTGDLTKAMQVVEYALQINPENSDAQQWLVMLRNNQQLPRPSRPQGAVASVRMAEVRRLDMGTQAGDQAMNPIQEARQKSLVELAGLLFDQAENVLAAPQPRGLGSLKGTDSLTLSQAETTQVILHLGQAIDSQTKGQDEQAIAELERVMEIGLSNPAAFYDLGFLHADRNGPKALKFLQKAVRNNTYALGSYLLMGKLYTDEQNWRDGAIAYLQALRLADAETVLPELAGELNQAYEPVIEAQMQQNDEAMQKTLCDTIPKQLMRPDWRNYLKSARAQLPPQPKGSPPMPLAELMTEPGSGTVIEALAMVRELGERGKYYTALEEAYWVLSSAPTYLPLHIQIGELLLQEGFAQEAVDKFMLVAELYNLRGETSQAVNQLVRLVQMAPMDLTVRGKLIEFLVANGREAEAIQQYMDLADIYYHLAELDMARNTYTSALRLAQQSKVDRSWTKQLLFKIADIDMQRLDWRQAVRVFEQIRTIEPMDPSARLQLVDLNFRMGGDALAYTEIDNYTSLLENSNKRKLAIEFMNKLVAERPEKMELRKRLSDLYVRNGQVDMAVEHLDAIADAYLTTGNRQAAMNMLLTIIALNPPQVAEYQYALSQLRSGN